MIKLDKTKYETNLGTKSAPELIKTFQKSKNIKYSRSIGHYSAIISAKISDIKDNLFFYRKYRKGKNVNWNDLITSGLELNAM